MIPAKADPERQAAYLETVLEPRLAQAQAGEGAVFFVDAAHFVLAPFLGLLWTMTRVFLPAPSGRQRFNVLGALNAITHELITVTNAGSITSQEVYQLLQQLAELPLEVIWKLPLARIGIAKREQEKCRTKHGAVPVN
jgi:hypothetical protein